MSKISTDKGTVRTLHPRETLFITGTIGSLNAVVITDCDSSSAVTLDLRGTFNLTIEVAGTVDGVNWTLIPMKTINQASKLYVASVAGSVPGTWIGSCSGFRQVRARCTAFTSGSATTFLAASAVAVDQSLDGQVTSNIVTTVGTAGSATTLTLATPGAGLRHYITYLSIDRFATALLTASATPVSVTTTNLPGSLAFTFAADALAQGAIDRWRENIAYPIAASAQGTATTIVCPSVTGVIWRITAGLYVAP